MERRTHVTSSPLTTFVQADTKTFRELVQRLTGSSEHDRSQRTATAGMKRLHERRSRYTTGSKLEIIKPPAGQEDVFPPSKSCKSRFTYSPSGTPSKSFSKLSIIEDDDKDRKVVQNLNRDEEERAINERRFYLHPSPRSAGYGEPELLSLFPLSSPNTSSDLL